MAARSSAQASSSSRRGDAHRSSAIARSSHSGRRRRWRVPPRAGPSVASSGRHADSGSEHMDLATTHTSTVTEDQIDHLGHMNVRFYAVNAHAATRTVLADLPGWDGRDHFVHDVYTRHLREQLLGARLAVRSAILDSSERALRVHHELIDRDSDELAATFVHGISPLDDGGRRLPLPPAVLVEAEARAIPHPAHASTRTISLQADLMATTPSLATVRER